MGKLYYDSTTSIDFEDRVLAHLQIVIGAKLRRGEAFPFSWRDDHSIGEGRNSLWLAPGISLHFKYYGSRPPSINPEWISELSALANTDAGLRLIAEPTTEAGKAQHAG